MIRLQELKGALTPGGRYFVGSTTLRVKCISFVPDFQCAKAYNRSMDAVRAEESLPANIAAALEQGATIVTANQRAARTLRHGFDLHNRALGRKSWQPAKVLAWDAWLSGWWSRMLLAGHVRPMILNRTQELAVWRGVLAADKDLASLKTLESLAEMTSDAWRMLCLYDGQSRLRDAANSTDTRAFQRWAMHFERRCATEGLLAQAGLSEALRRAVVALESRGEAPELDADEILLVGFDKLTPSQMGLIEALRAAGFQIEEINIALPSDGRVLVEAADEDEERRTCGRWVRLFLQQNPGATVGVIVPGLESQRAEIDRAFREVLAPEMEDIAAGSEATPYEFSVGAALATVPMVATALDLLRWMRDPLTVERVSSLLLSPYFAGGRAGLGARADLDAFALRQERMLRPEVSLEGLLALIEKHHQHDLSSVAGALRRLRQVRARHFEGAAAQSHAEWAEAMRETLQAASWGPGEQQDSVEFQTRAKWESVLDELATLDFDGNRVQFATALDEVERIARRTMFAPESREAPVQIMGPLEAAGSRFDAVWFLRGGELTWPMATASSPLLPWSMKVELGMPGTDASREMQHARRMTQRVAESAATVVFSYAATSSEGRQRHAKILDGLGLQEVSADEFVPTEAPREIVTLEEIEDAAQVAPLPGGILQGGAKVLELQAACGFRAFAEHRLWSSDLDNVELGMDAGESGVVVHKVLERLWARVETQAALLAMSASERAEVLDDAIRQGLAKIVELSQSNWDAAYMAIQRERLKRLLGPWLEQEMNRPEFVVKSLEQKLDSMIGPLRLSIRVDRVDETHGGDVLIDYKTGRAATKDWLTERPDAPQLPLYAVVAETERLGGVAFGVVRAGKEMSWKSFASGDDVMLKPGRMDGASFEDQVDGWRRHLTALAEQFAAGDARVRPKNFPQTCEHCGQRLVCRVEAALLEEGDEDEESEVNGG
jgi:ATP-dependent helicase/nuclease subunit B